MGRSATPSSVDVVLSGAEVVGLVEVGVVVSMAAVVCAAVPTSSDEPEHEQRRDPMKAKTRRARSSTSDR